jgi:hypothetical protein
MTASTEIVFVHGLGKKPSPENLRKIWLDALSTNNPRPDVFATPNYGLDFDTLGYDSAFCYWANVFYGNDYETDFTSYLESARDSNLEISIGKAEGLTSVSLDLPSVSELTPREQRLVDAIEKQLIARLSEIPSELQQQPLTGSNSQERYEIASWLPTPIKQAVIKKAAMEAYYYLFDKEYVSPSTGQTYWVRAELRKRLIEQLHAAAARGKKIVIVSHSMGTMLAYDVLRNVPTCPLVRGLITIGSPLGIAEVQEELRATDAKQIDFPAEKLESWINIYDPLDPVCGLDPKLNNDYLLVNGKFVVDQKESNWGSWRHTSTHYLAGKIFRDRLRSLIAD